MAQYRDLNAPPKRALADIVAELRDQAKSSKTGASGVKDLGESGDVVWPRPDGGVTSIRGVDLELTDARQRIKDAEASLGETGQRLTNAEQTIEAVRGDLTTLETVTLPEAVADLEAADQAAQEALGGLEERLGDFATDESLAPIREALADAQEAVRTAQSVAETANKAANAASQAALEAAGIAASKGRTIIQETEPQGEDRNAANIWIKPVPDNPDTEAEERATTYVYLEESDEWVPTTSDELAQAAQNALDAREAAQQAQQRADTAIANAEKAQGDAEAAQRTADQATTDASEAHNAAVAARDRADALMEAGESLLVNGGFEQGALGWGLRGNQTEIVETTDAYAGTHVLRITPRSVNTYPYADPVATATGRTYRITYMVRHDGQDLSGRIRQYNMITRADGSRQGQFQSEWYEAGEFEAGTWNRVTFDLTVTVEDAARIQFAPHFGISPNTYDIDEFRAVDITEALEAQRAADAAQARADEAYAEAAKKLDESQVDAKITASANGKNSITVSTSAPSADVPGVAVGDVWWRVDSSYNIFGQWSWNGSDWSPRQIRSEVIANLDVHKLRVTGNAKIAEAVISKLFAETFAAHKITGSELNISSVKPDGSLADDSVSAVTIKDGAVTTPKLTVTEDMSAKIVNAMSVNSKKLIVTDEAILNHATLIGKTVVDNINVQGKLIGKDGVFTGTVDFENINVTDEVLASRISGEHIYGTVIEGGLFKTSDALPGQVELADDGYIPSWSGPGARYPGIRVTPIDTSTTARPPGIGAYGDGMTIDGGKSTSGVSSFIVASPGFAFMRSKRANGGDGGTIQTGNDVALMGTARAGGGKGGIVQTSEASSFMRTYKDDGVTLGGSIETSPERSTVRTYSGNESESGWVKAETASAELAYVAPDNTYLSRIKTDVDEAFLYTRSGGTDRYLSVDANGVWVKTNRSGQWEAWNLEETASDSGWIGFTLRSGINGTGSPAFRVKAGVVYFRGTVTKTGNWEQGWTDIAGPFNPRYRPATTVQVMGSMTDDRRTLLRMSSDGYLSVYMRPAIAGTANLPLTPLSYLLG